MAKNRNNGDTPVVVEIQRDVVPKRDNPLSVRRYKGQTLRMTPNQAKAQGLTKKDFKRVTNRAVTGGTNTR